MSGKGKNQKSDGTQPKSDTGGFSAPRMAGFVDQFEQNAAKLKQQQRDPEPGNKSDIDLVIETLNSLPALRRYGKEEEAIEEAKAAMQRIKERL